MRKITCILFICIIILSGCKKNNGPTLSGTMTIDNKAVDQNYNIYGFYVPTGKKVLNLNNQQDVIIIQPDYAVDYTVKELLFVSNNFYNSFYRFGQYPDAAAASQIFKNLTSFSSPKWKQLGDSVKANQVWLFKTSNEKYAKLLIINTFTEKRADMPFPYAECTFEWVYQPDGSLTFPGK